MLAALGVPSLETLISQTVPDTIRFGGRLDLPEAVSEHDALVELREIVDRNVEMRSFIGQGYHGFLVPPVTQRNLLENPAWYTSYTSYQPEISQGRLEMLFNFQTLISELTGLPVANASLLDEVTAVAEAAGIAYRHHRMTRHSVCVANALHPQSRSVLETRMEPLDICIRDGEIDEDTAAVIFSWPDTMGLFEDPGGLVAKAHDAGALVIVITDPLALTLLRPPGEWGADIVVGSAQRFGVPLGFGGLHAAYIAVSDKHTRIMPGRLVGESVDAKGNPAYRLALQTREQHIRRDKATSNICAARQHGGRLYAIWHGPEGLQAIADHVSRLSDRLASGLSKAGFDLAGKQFLGTVTLLTDDRSQDFADAAEQAGYLLRVIDANRISISLDETASAQDVEQLLSVFGAEAGSESTADHLPSQCRDRPFLTQPIFHSVRSETEMMRYLRKLSDKDLALDRAMIPLDSCTMKLNAAAEMMPVSWPGSPTSIPTRLHITARVTAS